MNEKFITNDLDLDNKKKQLAIITGPNMAGKSTFFSDSIECWEKVDNIP